VEIKKKINIKPKKKNLCSYHLIELNHTDCLMQYASSPEWVKLVGFSQVGRERREKPSELNINNTMWLRKINKLKYKNRFIGRVHCAVRTTDLYYTHMWSKLFMQIDAMLLVLVAMSRASLLNMCSVHRHPIQPWPRVGY
jgi:hypothetical protein